MSVNDLRPTHPPLLHVARLTALLCLLDRVIRLPRLRRANECIGGEEAINLTLI